MTTKKLVLSKTTLKNLAIRTGVKTGLTAWTCTDICTEYNCGGGGDEGGYTDACATNTCSNCQITQTCNCRSGNSGYTC